MGADAADVREAWLEEWRAEDYTWKGLLEHPLMGWSVSSEGYLGETLTGIRYGGGGRDPMVAKGRPANLQDYWRATSEGRLRVDEEMGDELVSAEDQPTYHQIHLPFRYASGEHTAKNLELVQTLVEARLGLAGETFGAFRFKYGPSGWYAKGADRRAQLVGGIFGGAISGPSQATHVNAKRTCWADDAVFDAVEFGPAAEFTAALFERDARFHRARFTKDARFTLARFTGTVDFEGANFYGEAAFYLTHFLGDASFRSGSFEDTVWFTGARFGNVEFRAREFKGLAYFQSARFQKGMDFVCATFNELASFEQLVWPLSHRDWHAAFDHALFRSTATFRGGGFKAIASFSGAVFERGLQLDDLDESRADAAFRSELDGAMRAAMLDLEDWPRLEALRRSSVGLNSGPFSPSFVAQTESQARWIEREMLERAAGPLTIIEPEPNILEEKRNEFTERRLEELEGGCRTIKQAMALVSNKSREQMLYRFELIARRRQKGTPLAEKCFSLMYGVLADYGASIVKPIVAWLVLVILFALIFWIWIVLAGDVSLLDPSLAAEAAGFSWGNASRPLSAATVEEASGLSQVVKSGPWSKFAVQVAATIEALLSIVLIFLFALAVRRRFQME